MNEIVTEIDSMRMDALTRVFGEGSSLVEHSASAHTISTLSDPIASITSSTSYVVAVVVTIFLYIYWAAISVGSQEVNLYRESKRTSVDGLSERKSSLLNVMLTRAMFASLVVILWFKALEVIHTYNHSFADLLNMYNELEWTSIALGAFLTYWLWGVAILKISAWLSMAHRLTDSLFSLKINMLRLSTIYLLPFALFCAFLNETSMMLYLLMSVVVILIIFYIFKSFLLFRHEKVSILQWFLYLCAVEVFPLSFLWVCVRGWV